MPILHREFPTRGFPVLPKEAARGMVPNPRVPRLVLGADEGSGEEGIGRGVTSRGVG